MKIPFGELRTSSPGDAGIDAAGGDDTTLLIAENVIPIRDGYSSCPAFSTTSGTALSARCQGAYSALNGTSVQDFAGDVSKLYTMTGSTAGWSDVSAVGGYSTDSTDFWEFAQFGKKVLATNCAKASGSGGTVPQAWTLGSSSAFAALGGSPPMAKHIAVIRDFVVLGHTYDTTDGEVSSRVRWSGFGDETSWAVSAATQADLQDLKAGNGAVRRIVGGQTGVILQDTAVTTMEYVGPPAVFRFNEITGAEGTLSPQSVVVAGGAIYYYGRSGFWRLSMDGSFTNISAGRVDALINAYVDPGEETQFIIGAYDGEFNAIIWIFGGTSSAGNAYGLIYSITENRWSSFTPLEGGATPKLDFGYTSAIYTSSGVGTPQSKAWFFDRANLKSQKLDSSTTYTARIDTQHLELAEGRMTVPSIVRPEIYSADSANNFSTKSLYIFSTSDRMVGAGSRTQQTLNTTTGYWQGRNNGRFHRFSMELKATYPFSLRGLILDKVSIGGRV